MKRFPIRPVAAGVLIGAALFFAPFFLLRAVLFVLLVSAIVRLFNRERWHRYGMQAHGGYRHSDASSAIQLRDRNVRDISID